MSPHRRALYLTVVLAAAFLSGCASMATVANSFAPPAAPEGWTREQFRITGSGCLMRNCHTSLKSGSGSIEVTTRLQNYARRDVPGWGELTGDRVAGVIGGGIVRTLGGSTEQTRVVHGPLAVTEGPSDGWKLTCTMFGMFVEASNSGGRVTPLTGGTSCRAAARSDSTQVLWRYTRGVAPPFDSVARVYDSLTAERSPLISVSPPMTLDRLSPDGTVAARYEIVMVSLVRMLVSRENREPIAAIHSGLAMLDLAPGATPAEARIARLIAASMVAPEGPPSSRPGGRPPLDH